jgi:hypothetical protein
MEGSMTRNMDCDNYLLQRTMCTASSAVHTGASNSLVWIQRLCVSMTLITSNPYDGDRDTKSTLTQLLAQEDLAEFTFILGTFLYILAYFLPYLSSSYNILSLYV